MVARAAPVGDLRSLGNRGQALQTLGPRVKAVSVVPGLRAQAKGAQAKGAQAKGAQPGSMAGLLARAVQALGSERLVAGPAAPIATAMAAARRICTFQRTTAARAARRVTTRMRA